jgi:hypothetical protein
MKEKGGTTGLSPKGAWRMFGGGYRRFLITDEMPICVPTRFRLFDSDGYLRIQGGGCPLILGTDPIPAH